MNVPSEKQALKILPKRLALVLRLNESEVHGHKPERLGTKPFRADFLITAGPHEFVTEYKSRSNAADILNAIRVVQEQVPSLGKNVIPLVVVPYMGEVGQELCEAAGVNWLDLSGNVHLETRGLHIHVEGKKNQFIRSGRPSTVFAPKSARIARWLLMHREQSFSQQQLAVLTGLDKGLTSRVVRELEKQHLVTRDSSGVVKLARYDAMLDAWREAYDFSKHHIVRGHVAARSSDQVLQQISRQLKRDEIQYAATGLAAAWLLDGFAGFRLVVFFVAQMPSTKAQQMIGFREESRGENVWLVVPNDQGVFQGAKELQSIQCVHPVQAYLDLKNHPERSAEAAEELRRKLLKIETHA